MREKTEGQRATIKNESGNGLSNFQGTIAMARTARPQLGHNQFFINLDDNNRLDMRAADMPSLVRSPTGWMWSTRSPRSRPEERPAWRRAA